MRHLSSAFRSAYLPTCLHTQSPRSRPPARLPASALTLSTCLSPLSCPGPHHHLGRLRHRRPFTPPIPPCAAQIASRASARKPPTQTPCRSSSRTSREPPVRACLPRRPAFRCSEPRFPPPPRSATPCYTLRQPANHRLRSNPPLASRIHLDIHPLHHPRPPP